MKRYYVRQIKDGKVTGPYAQFPANDKAQSLIQGYRHAKSLGIPDDEIVIAYIGKWKGAEVNPEEFTARAS